MDLGRILGKSRLKDPQRRLRLAASVSVGARDGTSDKIVSVAPGCSY